MDSTNVPTGGSVEKGWFDILKEKFNIDALTKKFDLSKDKIITLLFYLAGGFLAGVLIKKFAKYIIVLALVILGIYLLQTKGVLTLVVNWPKFYEVLGIKAIPQVSGNMLSLLWKWIMANLAISISSLVGFIIGWKVS